MCVSPGKCLPDVRLTTADPALNETGWLRVPVVDLEFARRRLGQEGLARSTRSIQKNAVLNHPVLFESLGVKPVLHDRADAALLIVHTADVSKCPRRDVGPSGLLVLSVASSPCGGLYGTDAWSMADYEDQTANSNYRKNQSIHQFERRSAVAGKHHPGYSVLVEQELVNRVEPMENGEQGDEVEQPAVGILGFERATSAGEVRCRS